MPLLSKHLPLSAIIITALIGCGGGGSDDSPTSAVPAQARNSDSGQVLSDLRAQYTGNTAQWSLEANGDYSNILGVAYSLIENSSLTSFIDAGIVEYGELPFTDFDTQQACEGGGELLLRATQTTIIQEARACTLVSANDLALYDVPLDRFPITLDGSNSLERTAQSDTTQTWQFDLNWYRSETSGAFISQLTVHGVIDLIGNDLEETNVQLQSFSDGSQELIDIVTTYNAQGDIVITGQVFLSQYGYLDISTTTPFTWQPQGFDFHNEEVVYNPSDLSRGTLTFTGANGSLTISFDDQGVGSIGEVSLTE